MLLTAQNLRLLLDHGFTSIFEAASAKPMLGVTARNAINSGLIAGPRMRAGSPACPDCGGQMKIIAALTDPASIRPYV